MAEGMFSEKTRQDAARGSQHVLLGFLRERHGGSYSLSLTSGVTEERKATPPARAGPEQRGLQKPVQRLWPVTCYLGFKAEPGSG